GRRRHTRSYGDWSSDVCSSDLHVKFGEAHFEIREVEEVMARLAAARPGDGVAIDGLGPVLDAVAGLQPRRGELPLEALARLEPRDRKSTRLNSSHRTISYAVFC